MPLSLPNLDQRRYDDLVREALEIIPVIAPEWTNHNASDPGITLVELLAYLTEILIYRVNQIGDRQLAAFVSLLTGEPAATDRPVAAQAREAVAEIRRITRAVTCEDFEKLASECGRGRVARAHCLAGYNLTTRMDDHRRAGHVSIVILPVRETKERHPRPSQELIAEVRRGLEEYRLIATRVHVVAPHYVTVRIAATVILRENAPEPEVRQNLTDKLQQFLDVLPEKGKPGWPFGQDVYASQLYEVIERQPGVDYVSDLTLETDDSWRYLRNAKGEVVGIDLRENELPMAHIRNVGTRFPMRSFEH
jgi:hypothetical protein